MSEARLDRIEQKLDKLVDVVESIARVEEKMVASNLKVDRLEHRMDKQEKDINEIGKIARNNSGVARFADKFFWIIIGAMVSLAVYFMKSSVG